MELIGQEKKDNNDEKIKKILKWSIIFTVIIFFIVLIVMLYFAHLESKQLKLVIDKKRTNIPENLFVFDSNSNKVYVSIQDIAKMVGYDYYNGDYNQLNEDQSQCYVNNQKEVAGFELGSNKLYKVDPNAEKHDYDWFDLDEPVKTISDKLYVTSDSLQMACNLKFNYNKERNLITISTLPYLVSVIEPTVINNYGFSGLDSEYKSQKAILHDMLVVKRQESKDKFIYGVITKDNKQIIGLKYDKIEYIEVANDFYVTTGKKCGIFSNEGSQKIAPEYDEIKVLDNDTRLYYVKNNNLCGVLDKNGKRIVYIEYNQIGIDSTLFPSNGITNSMFLFDNCIPVMKDNQWGLIDKNGNVIVDVAYDSLGYINGAKKDAKGENLLTIDSIEGIVTCKNNKYGIVNSTGKFIAPVAFDKIYAITNLGEKKVYLEYNGQTLSLEDYLKMSGNDTGTSTQTTGNVIEERPSTDQNTTNTSGTDSISVNAATIDEVNPTSGGTTGAVINMNTIQ